MKTDFIIFPDLINIIQVAAAQFMPPTGFVPVVISYWSSEAAEM
jgi:hypothetical protein